jgi:phosphoribosyl-ATP pyrophosphohydrolase
MAAYSLKDLEKRVQERAQASADVSYTRKLLDRGVAHCAKKLGEEAVETSLAAIAQDKTALANESADLIYHLLVLWAVCGLEPAEVYTALAAREGKSGLDEKAARKG